MWRGTQPVVQYISVYLLELSIQAPLKIFNIHIKSIDIV